MSKARQACDEDLFEAQKVVRKFSWKTYSENPEDDLAKSLVAAESLDKQFEGREATLNEQWMYLFNPTKNTLSSESNEEIMLASTTDELAKAYRSFQKCLPKGQEARIEDGPPRFKAVVEAVSTADSAWKKNKESTRSGKLKTLFGKVCGSLDSYKNLFAVLPSGDKYVCLVTGSLSAIVKATVNHEKIAEGVSDALDGLSDDVQYWQRTLEIYTDDMLMREYVAKLYVVVFKFLTRMMTKWYKSSKVRFLRSFESNFFKDEIEDKKEQIKDLQHRLERQGSLSMKASIKATATREDVEKIQQLSQEKFQMELELQAKKLQIELGRTVKNALQEQFLNMLWVQQDHWPPGSSPSKRSREASPMPDHSGDSSHAYLRKQIQLTARRFLQYNTQQEHVQTMVAQSQNLSMTIEIFDRIQTWNAAKRSRYLWIQGPFQVPSPSRYTLLSTYVLATAQSASLPAISYYCEPGSDIVEMIYSLILQLAEVIPYDFESDLDFTSPRFEALDGTPNTLIDAVYLFKDLLSVGPYLLFIILDGMQVLDTASNAGLLTKFIDVLRSASDCGGPDAPRTLKVLFTTDGFVDALTSFKGDERLDALDFTGEEDGAADADAIEVGFLS